MKASIAFGSVVCGGVAGFTVHYVIQAKDQGTAAAVAQGLAAVLVPLAGVVVWLLRGRIPGVPQIDMQQAADNLANRIGEQWRREEERRHLFDRPLDVRWTWSQRRLSGTPEAAVGDQRVRLAPLPGFSRIELSQLGQGDLNDLFEIYGGLDSGRIILVGAPGAGKSGALIRLLRDALMHRKRIKDAAERSEVPVPVLLSAYDWLPGRDSLDEWVIRRLEDEHAFLRARVAKKTAARALVDGGHISLLLDGIDEMPKEARTLVLRAIGDQTSYRRIVLTSRPRALACAVKAGQLRSAAALELIPITARRAADYLGLHADGRTQGPWSTLIQHLRENETGAVAKALNSPLMLSLLLDTYRDDDPVDELANSKHFPDCPKIKRHLLQRVLPAAYPSPGDDPYALEQAQQWLGHLAAQMNEDGTRDLAWWRIPQWMPPRHRRISLGLVAGFINALVSGLSFGIATGIMFGPTAGLVAGLAVGLASGAVFGLAAGLASGLAVGLKSGLAIGATFGLEIGLAAGIMDGLRFGLTFGFTGGLTIAFTVAVTITLTVGLTAGLTNRPVTTDHGRFPPQRRGLGRRNRLLLRDVTGVLMLGLAAGLGIGLAAGLAAGLAVGAELGLGIGIAGGIAGGVGGGLASVLIQGFNTSDPADELLSPVGSFQGNHRLVLAIEVGVGLGVGITTGVAFAISVWVGFGIPFGSAFEVGVASGSGVGVVAGIAAGATDVNFFMPTCVAFALMRYAGWGPVRMLRFLEDARRRGVLRTAGPVYQFRHVTLQHFLADPQRTLPAATRTESASASSAMATQSS